MQLVWSSGFSRELKRLLRQNPQMNSQIEQTLEQLALDPFDPSLKTHKLKGDLANCWSCSVNYSDRIVFQFVENSETVEEEILLLTVGSHDEVY
ncbi:type II toxin-antitoxin system RelE/ParE family toxin [Leptolyngbya sp. NIES-2104]|uniref:type II toxin-antitoxin system RelE/ParE family toxin n=1 Tax=Leptolyngbya sp. NIES-2104 TaxID=1552121 RepID=UPI0006ECB1E3|nr:type II toxin-antitoxin system mRNA interferase toxin, RelE/StbE family [Leptolyngbya sp. NIES-2104]GAP94069.1 HigB toxin protein [Leptolyngbya sp. NIES-2104]